MTSEEIGAAYASPAVAKIRELIGDMYEPGRVRNISGDAARWPREERTGTYS